MAKSIINRLSDRRVRTAGPGMHPDGGGLYLRVTAAADDGVSRYWLFRYAHRGTGKDRQLGLGPIITVSLAQARTAARECRELLLAGKDPVDYRRAQEASQALASSKAMTFDQCRDAYIAAHVPGWSNAKHAKQWTSTLAAYVTPVFGNLPVSVIDTGHVLKVLEPMWATKTETASRIRGRIENVMDWARVRGYRSGENPAQWKGHLDHLLPVENRVKKARHHPALPYQQIGQFMAELRAHPSTAARALEFTILTGTRSEESLRARWCEIDWGAKLWTVPAERMKGRRPHAVTLSDQALALLRALRDSGNSEFVFPGSKPGQPVGETAMFELVRQLNYKRLKAGLPIYADPKQDNRRIVPHGFRSTLRDWAGECTNFPREVCEMALAHRTFHSDDGREVGSKTEEAYRRGDMLEKRRKLMDAWGRYCSRPAGKAEVVPIRRSM